MNVKEIMENEKVAATEYSINQPSAAEAAIKSAKIYYRTKACSMLECLNNTISTIMNNYEYICADENAEREYNNLLYLLEECARIEQRKIGGKYE